jgi:hypothetical protein
MNLAYSPRGYAGTIWYDKGPSLTVAATAGTALPVLANAQGPGGIGIESGKFTIESNALTPAPSLTEVAVTASGTGDDAAALTEVAIYRDNLLAGTQGVYDAADIVACSAAVFPSNDGTINFPVVVSEQGFGASETRTFFVVTKLAGNALPGHEFKFTVSDITVGSGAKSVPANSIMNGLVIDTPVFVVADASLAAPEPAPLGTASVCQEFTIAYPDGPDDKPASLTVTGLGTADEVADLVNTEL